MSQDISVLFLGTSSGGGPTTTRNCSSLVMDIVGDGSLWMVDCAEGTSRQFERQPFHGGIRFKRGRLTNIFITHMHADHTMGIVGLLKNLLGIPKPGVTPSLKIELFGPRGLRSFVRTLFTMTATNTLDQYTVHELLGVDEEPSTSCTPESLHESEVAGLDIRCGEEGFWREITHVKGRYGRKDVFVDAGPIIHRVPCIGYVMRESQPEVPIEAAAEQEMELPEQTTPLLRKLVVLGDTRAPEAIVPLINSTPGQVSLLIHEATDCCIPHTVDPEGITGRNRTVDSVHATSMERGHSTPDMAGQFANAIEADRLILNHIGGRFPAPPIPTQGPHDRFRLSVMQHIEAQATNAWGHPRRARAVAAFDYMRVVIPPLRLNEDEEMEPEPALLSPMPRNGPQNPFFRGRGGRGGRGGYHGPDSAPNSRTLWTGPPSGSRGGGYRNSRPPRGGEGEPHRKRPK